MRKLITLFAAVAFSAMALVSTAGNAEARRWHRGYGGGIAAAVIGSALIYGLAHRHHRRHYYSYYDDGYGYGYYPRHRYYSSFYSYPNYGYRRHHRHGIRFHHRHHRRHW